MKLKVRVTEGERVAAIDDIARVLTSYIRLQREMSRAIAKQPKKRSRKKIRSPRGTFHQQSVVLKSIYKRILKVDAFTDGRPDFEEMGPKGVFWYLREIATIVREAFRKAYRAEFNSKRQRQSVWSSVIRFAWYQSVMSDDFVEWLVKEGGIEEAAKSWALLKPSR